MNQESNPVALPVRRTDRDGSVSVGGPGSAAYDLKDPDLAEAFEDGVRAGIHHANAVLEARRRHGGGKKCRT